MGEIGISRKEFFYELQWWEVNAIIRGYRKRNILSYQLQRLTAYSAFFGMRENKNALTPQEWQPLYFDEDDDTAPITEEEQKEMLAEMEALKLI